MDHIKSQVDGLAELSDEQVVTLQESIVREFELVEGKDPSPEVVDAMTSLADMLDTVRGETSRREAAKEELASRAAEAAMRVNGEDEEMPVDDMPAEEAPAEEVAPVEDEESAMGNAPVLEDEEKKKAYSAETSDASMTQVEGSEFSTEKETQTTTTVEEVQQEEQAPVTAAAEETFQAPADRQPVIQVSEPAKVAITAGADIPGYSAGSSINDMSEVALAMEKRIHSLRRVNGGDGEQHIVASITTEYPEARTLTTDAESNALKIAAVAGPEALVASGGHAAPFEVKYDIYSIGSSNVRPLRDALPRFQADRGGIRFVTPPSFAAGTYDTAVGVWTAANDSATTPSPAAKTSYTVTAAAENTKATDAVTLQLQFGNLMTRAYPELIARHNELALVQHAREAEQNIITQLGTGSTAVTTTNLIGFGRDFLVQIRRAAVAYRNRHRIANDTQLQAFIPEWVYDAMAADLTLAMPGDGTLSVSKSEIDGYLSNSNVTLVASPDMTVFGSQSAAALLEFPDSFDWFLFAEGTFLFLDGGTLDLGIIRDSGLVGTNDYKMFIETFEAVAKVGIESLKITSTISINGVAAALRDTTGNTAAATIEL